MLIGQVKQRELETWYNSANYYISGSHEESCGFALLEAMACGCIPIVTNIPTFRKITKQGELGLLFEPGDEDSLIAQLSKLPLLEEEQLSDKITAYFEKELSFREIAADLYLVCKRLCIN